MRSILSYTSFVCETLYRMKSLTKTADSRSPLCARLTGVWFIPRDYIPEMGIDSQVQAGRILTGTESISLKVKASNARHIYGKVNGLPCRRISIQQGGWKKKNLRLCDIYGLGPKTMNLKLMILKYFIAVLKWRKDCYQINYTSPSRQESLLQSNVFSPTSKCRERPYITRIRFGADLSNQCFFIGSCFYEAHMSIFEFFTFSD